jgi:protein O-mannosyl-transferase
MITRPLIAPRLVLPAACVLALLLYAPALPLTFFSDDFSVLHRIGERGDLGTGSFFRPLPDLSLYFNWLLAGPRPWAFRLINVLLLGINAWLVYHLAQRLDKDQVLGRGMALLAALLFLVFPFHSEPQFWIIARSTALATTFTLGALVFALGSGPVTQRAFGVAVCAALGVLCYESALLLPVMLAALWPCFRGKDARALALFVLITTGIVALDLLARSWFTGHVANAYGASFFAWPWQEYPVRLAKAAARLVLPPLDDEGQQLWRAAAAAVGMVVLGLVVLRRTRGATPVRSILVVLVLLTLVALGIAVVGGVSTRTSESDRFLYLPSAFFLVLVACVVRLLLRGATLMMAVAACVVLCCIGIYTTHRNWRSASGIIERLITTTPDAPVPGRLLVHHLPGDHRGAFIFRHGFQEALDLAGRDAARIVAVADGPDPIGATVQTLEGDTVAVEPADRWFDARDALRP